MSELLNMKYQSPLSFDFLESYNRKNPQTKVESELPFYPKDYNKQKLKFEFPEEYLEQKLHEDEEAQDTHNMIEENVQVKEEHQKEEIEGNGNGDKENENNEEE